MKRSNIAAKYTLKVTTLLLVIGHLCLEKEVLAGTLANSPTTQRVIWNNNRRHVAANDYIVSGGWGPHLRGFMRDPQGKLWFPFDQASYSLSNILNQFFSLWPTGWFYQKPEKILPGVRQNMASYMLANGSIKSYAIATQSDYSLQECTYVTSNFNLDATCLPLKVNGNNLIVPLAGYMGAVIGTYGTYEMVYWTKSPSWNPSVGKYNSNQGSFEYIYRQQGGKWIGPISTPLAVNAQRNYWTYEYVRANLDSAGTFTLVGQASINYNPSQNHLCKTILVTTVDKATGKTTVTDTGVCTDYTTAVAVGVGPRLGAQVQFTELQPPVGSSRMKTAEDIFFNIYQRTIHVMAGDEFGYLQYYFFPSLTNMDKNSIAREKISTVGSQGRFIYRSSLHKLAMIYSNDETGVVTVRRSGYLGYDQSPVAWRAQESINIDLNKGMAGFGKASALFAESSQYHPNAIHDLNFGIVGNFDGTATGKDNIFMHLEIKDE